MNGRMEKILDTVRMLIYVPKCAYCGQLISIKDYRATCPFCPECYGKIHKEFLLPCPKCGRRPVECICGISADKKQYIDREYHLATYNIEDGMTNKLVRVCKLKDVKFYYDFISDEISKLITERIGTGDGTVLTYVPRAPSRILDHGFDQCKLAAEKISEKTKLPLVVFIKHRRSGKMQKTLDFTERKVNARKSYYLDDDYKKYIRGREVILYDDTITTGATVIHCARLLKSAGAKRVYTVSLTKSAKD